MLTRGDMTDAEREQYEERAGIVEFDGKLRRHVAERIAREEIERDRQRKAKKQEADL